ncbi:DMT family transporter [uncultured Aquitalea sp.]|uniref:DMT family transporter n=1 Tax=uncultured Aquitalea sp. TaxID=540272 RepID=UPI0025CC6537|nr:DMT family transporter [uncultured Aquitalea sp.]
MPHTTHPLLGQFKILLSSIGFGSMAIFARFAYAEGVSTPTLLFLRFALAACLLLPWCLAKGLPWPRGRSLLVLCLMGSLGYAGMAACYFTGLHYASAGTVSLLLYLFPAIVLVLSTLLFKEPFTRRRLLATSLAIAGLIITVGQQLSAKPLGLALGLASAVIYSLYILAGSRLTRGGHPLTSACVVVMSAAACYGGWVLLDGFNGPQSAFSWAAIFGIAVLGTVAALALFLSGLESTGATQASLIATAEPVVTILLAWLFLGEALTLSQAVGGALILLAVVLISRESRPEEVILTDLHD